MYRRIIAVLLVLSCLASSTAFAAAQTTPPTTKTEIHVYPLVLAVGALAGVATMNYLTYGVGVLPLSVGMESTAPIISPAAAAASRVYVITSAVLGAWIASAIYGS
ncbi:MAG: hypothetical protein WCP34_01870 [Pseudomonadota bacterium]